CLQSISTGWWPLRGSARVSGKLCKRPCFQVSLLLRKPGRSCGGCWAAYLVPCSDQARTRCVGLILGGVWPDLQMDNTIPGAVRHRQACVPSLGERFDKAVFCLRVGYVCHRNEQKSRGLLSPSHPLQ